MYRRIRKNPSTAFSFTSSLQFTRPLTLNITLAVFFFVLPKYHIHIFHNCIKLLNFGFCRIIRNIQLVLLSIKLLLFSTKLLNQRSLLAAKSFLQILLGSSKNNQLAFVLTPELFLENNRFKLVSNRLVLAVAETIRPNRKSFLVIVPFMKKA